MVVTLEPCAHTGRTPPCVEALVRAGVRRCVVALKDPHAIVNGRGLRWLERAGVEVEVGLCAEDVREALGGYLLAHTERRPRVTWKVAMTLDGRIADGRGRSRWITGEAARRHAHRLRAASDAVLIGSGTARSDDPRLTVRHGRRGGPQPLRVVCDTRLASPPGLRLFGPALGRGTIVACGLGVGREQGLGRQEKCRRAVAALRRADLGEGLLQGMQPWAVGHAFDGLHAPALAGEPEDEAGQHGEAVYQDRARATFAQLAAVLRAGEAQVLPQHFEQRLVGGEAYVAGLAVQIEAHAET